MKRYFLLVLALCVCFTNNVFADPGDTLTDQNNALWMIASNKVDTTNFIDILIDRMETMPNSYQALTTMTKFSTWLEIEILYNYNKLYPSIVYQVLLSKFIGYEYDNPRLAEEFEPPAGWSVNGSDLSCPKDPTSANREVKLWKLISGQFVEQGAGTLNGDNWEWTGLTAGTYVLAYDDNFASLPSVQFP